MRRRDEKNLMHPEPYMDKVYHWTIDLSIDELIVFLRGDHRIQSVILIPEKYD